MMLSRSQKRALEDLYEVLLCSTDESLDKSCILDCVTSALEQVESLAKDFGYEMFSEGDARSLEDAARI
jgi:hypothetical protein